ncbi:MAG TPA: EamA family transporter [Casimicrobiaceae bacterium]|nr:EamA family transporter [Casimicrobiaceae bacterium]
MTRDAARRAGSVPQGRASIPALFAVATIIWGSTWLAIKFQLGVVAPGVSVAYRFALAAIVLALWCAATGRGLALPLRAHAWMAAQGVTLFGLNYVAVYEAERHAASGLVAVVFSTIVFMTPLGARLAFRTPVSRRTLAGAALGVSGVALLFLPALRDASHDGSVAVGIGWAFVATAIAAVGNLVSLRMQRDRLPVLPSAAWGMGYGALVAAAGAVATGTPWTFDTSAAYVASLAYLAVFGSVAAFAAYLTLLQKAGPGPASFVGVSTPVLAMVLSTAFEGYAWTWGAVAGVALAVVGNALALRARG